VSEPSRAPLSPAPLLEVRDLRVSLGRGRARTEILHGVDLSVASGEIVGLIGETGSGKTTLARTVLGLARIDSGAVTLGGTDVGSIPGRRLRAFRRAGLAQYVFQDPLQSLDPQLSVASSVGEGLAVRGGLRRDELRARVLDALDLVGLEPSFADRLPSELSGGQRQRVAIARAMVLEPGLLICDEPVSALDAASRGQVLELLAGLPSVRELGMLFISHDLGSVASITDRIVVLYRGVIIESGSTERVLTEPRHPYTRLLVGSAPTLRGGAADRGTRAELRALLADHH